MVKVLISEKHSLLSHPLLIHLRLDHSTTSQQASHPRLDHSTTSQQVSYL